MTGGTGLFSEVLPALWRGLVIGFCLAAPVGPIGVICIRRAITGGPTAGFIAGLGAATADIFYGIVAAYGVTVIISALTQHRSLIELVGGAILIILGVGIIRAKTPTSDDTEAENPAGFARTYFSCLLIAIANPATIVAFLGVFAAVGPSLNAMGKAAPLVMVAGVFSGSAGWWLLLSYGSSALGKKLSAGGLHVMNICSGGLILALGLWQFVQLARSR